MKSGIPSLTREYPVPIYGMRRSRLGTEMGLTINQIGVGRISGQLQPGRLKPGQTMMLTEIGMLAE